MTYDTVEKILTIIYALLSPLIGFILAVFEMAKRS